MSDYKINNIEVCPTEFAWLPRRPIGVSPDGHFIYAGIRSAQMKWEYTTHEEWSNLQWVFDQIQSTGTTVVQIPAYPTGTNQPHSFREYSGVTVSEPAAGPQFEGFPSNITLVITNINVGV
jgi:hypothetical protein